MATKVVYIISCNPRTRTEKISAVLAQALTALSFGYECEIFLMDEAVTIIQKGAIDGVKFKAFESITDILKHYLDLKGKLYVCQPSSDARELTGADCIDGIQFVNAPKLLESSKNADMLFTF